MKIFISHTMADRAFANRLANFLVEKGHEVILQKSVGAPSEKSVLKLIGTQMFESEIFIIIWGQDSYKSRSARSELLAVKMLVDTDEKKYIFPIILDRAMPPREFAQYITLNIDSIHPDFPFILANLERIRAPNDIAKLIDAKQPKINDIESLRKAHREGKMTLVCGAGISIGARIPPWNTLLERLLDAMLTRLMVEKMEMDAARVELNDIRENSSLIAGRYLKNVLQDDFQEEVRSALYKDAMRTCPTIDAIVELARPKRGKAHLDSIISFNFDDLLEENFRLASIEHKPIFSEGNRSASTELPIFHVHGYLPRTGKLKKDNKIVFSEDSYHDQFVDPFSWSNLTQLNKFTQNTCLFVGLSMTDPNLRRLLDVAIRRDGEGGKRHYAILKRNSNSSKNRMMESLREQDAASLGITILWVNDFEDIPILIRNLA